MLAGEALVGKGESELAHVRRRHIGLVFQFFNLLEDTSALENVGLPHRPARAPPTRPCFVGGAPRRYRARTSR
ncbi:MAG: hypothetical protein M3322_00520 [Actinomycetota bacterium]|nr:hypothetical protein [Actinomycetota bacterium]